MSILSKIRSRLAILPLAREVKRRTGKGIWSQLVETTRLRMGETSLRPWEYYEFRLWDDEKFSWEDKVQFGGDVFKKILHKKLNNPAWEVLMTDKLASCAVFDHCGLPYPEIHAIAGARPRSYGDAPFFGDAASLGRYLREEVPYPFFVKPIKGGLGQSCAVVEAWDKETDSFRFGDQTSEDVTSFLAGLKDPTGYGFFFSEVLQTHPTVRALAGGTVSSFRLVMLLHDDKPPTLHRGIWKVPSGQTMVDNFANGKTGNMIAAFDHETGAVKRVISGIGMNYTEVTEHPVTGASFEGFVLPCWPETVELMQRAAQAFPACRWQNWDVAITDRGPVILELNSAGDLYLSQYGDHVGSWDEELRTFTEKHAFEDDVVRVPFADAQPPTKAQAPASSPQSVR